MRNVIYEAALDKQGLTWTYVEKLPLDDVEPAKGLKNQARMELPIDQELVDAYVPCYKRKPPDPMPPLVLWRPSGRAKWGAMDGNHRYAAMRKAGLDHCDAYCIEISDQTVIDRVTWSFNNAVNGRRLTKEESRAHAITMVRKYGVSSKDAAEQWGLNYTTLKTLVRCEELKDVLAKNGVDHSKLGTAILHNLSTLESVGQDVLCLAAKTISANGLGQKEAAEIAEKVKAAKTHEAKLQVVEDYATRPEVVSRKAETKGGRVKPKKHPRDVLEDLVAKINRLYEDFPDDVSLRPPQFKMKKLREDMTDMVNRSIRICGLGAVLPKENAG